jgi:hypothetical protein
VRKGSARRHGLPCAGRKKKKRPPWGQKEESHRLRRERHQNGASANQRDLNDVDGREIYLLELITHPRYHLQKIPGAETTRCRELLYPAPRRPYLWITSFCAAESRPATSLTK